jgi:hypothetical protein
VTAQRKLNLSSNMKTQPGDPDYWERSRLEMFATCIGYFVREYHQPPKAHDEVLALTC